MALEATNTRAVALGAGLGGRVEECRVVVISGFSAGDFLKLSQTVISIPLA